MQEHLRVVSEWSFMPEDLFGEDVEFVRPDHNICVKKGIFEVNVTGQLARDDATIRDDVERELRALLAGTQLRAQKPVSLNLKNFSRVTGDGRRGVTIFAEPAVFTITAGPVDFVIKDKDGNIITDTKAERMRGRQFAAQRVLQYNDDPTLAAITASYQQSLKDPSNALVHLYEIRDALKAKFGGRENAAISTLRVDAQWRELGKLANSVEIREGRHRGTFRAAGLRDATADELKKARNSATALIEAYLDYIDGNVSAG